MPQPILRRPRPLAAAGGLYAAAAVCAIFCLPAISDPDALYNFVFNLYYKMNITDTRTFPVYIFLRGAALVLAFLGPVLMAFLTWFVWADRKGLRVVTFTSKGLFYITWTLGIGLALLFVYKATVFSIFCIRANLAILILSMLFFEGILASIVEFTLYMLTKLFRSAEEAADSLYYTALTGKPEPSGIAPLLYRGLIFAGAATCLLSLVRLPDIPGMLSFLLCGCGDLILGISLLRCRRLQERQWYYASGAGSVSA